MKIRLDAHQAEKYVEGLVNKRLRIDPVYKNITDPLDKLLYGDKVETEAWAQIESQYEVI